MLSAAVVTVTSGRKLLDNCIKSVENQTYPVKHYIVTDAGVVDFPEYIGLSQKYRNDNRFVSYWDNKIEFRLENGLNAPVSAQGLFSAVPAVVNEDVLFFLNDDDWYEANHVESLMSIINSGYDWAYSFRKIFDFEGTFLFDDICESLGEEHHVWNMPGHHFAETCSVAMKTKLFRKISNIYTEVPFGADRVFYQEAKKRFPNFKGSKRHTMCFRLNGNPQSVTKEFFEAGNSFMKDRYGNAPPWF